MGLRPAATTISARAIYHFGGRLNQKTRGISLRTSPVLRLESMKSAYGRKYIKLHKKRELQKKNRSVHREHEHNTESIKKREKNSIICRHREDNNFCNLLQINETDDRYRHTVVVVLTLIIILFVLVSGSCLVSRT